MYTLFYSPGTASLAVHLALVEIGAPHRLELVDFANKAQQSEEYLRLNPRGRVPTLVIDGHSYVESAALLMMLADRHPDSKLGPVTGSPERQRWYQWMVFMSIELGARFRQWFYPPDLGQDPLPPTQKDAVRGHIENAFGFLDKHLSATGPYMLGEAFSMADLQLLMYMRWSRNMPRPATQWPALMDFARRVRQRESWQCVCEIEQLEEWRSPED